MKPWIIEHAFRPGDLIKLAPNEYVSVHDIDRTRTYTDPGVGFVIYSGNSVLQAFWSKLGVVALSAYRECVRVGE